MNLIKKTTLGTLVMIAASTLTGFSQETATAAPAAQQQEEISSAEWIRRAQSEYLKGNVEESLKILAAVLEKEPDNFQARYSRARLLSSARQFDKAIQDYDQLIKVQPETSMLYHHRGEAYFRSGALMASYKDFNQFLKLTPQYAPQHWQRGLVCYYLEKYAEGVEQFEIHQAVNPSDVENAVWHFMCLARLESPAKARSRLIPIGDDSRVPMMEIYDLFKGDGSVGKVLEAARAGKESMSEERWKNQMFYAYQYIGLYYEAYGLDQNARQAMKKAATEFAMDHYMGDVAKVHWDLMVKQQAANKPLPAKEKPVEK